MLTKVYFCPASGSFGSFLFVASPAHCDSCFTGFSTCATASRFTGGFSGLPAVLVELCQHILMLLVSLHHEEGTGVLEPSLGLAELEFFVLSTKEEFVSGKRDRG